MRPNTERPVTITQGTNQFCNLEDLEKNVEAILSGKATPGNEIEQWDGQTASRVVKSIKTLLNKPR